MTAAQFSAVISGIALVIVVIALAVVVKRKGTAIGIEPGRPDRVSADVVTGLMAELRKWQAECAYWKAAAERLQHELEAAEASAAETGAETQSGA